ncbi:pantoate--beta-alanine ligase [Pseudogracilibacillus sp. SO30301A]|uniref:pantoate--beta-alanine ligase n=1 Tax=Pseudogracilibacillus sp. SO30301A TaxID=3098291 RepID=UPI00300DBF54
MKIIRSVQMMMKEVANVNKKIGFVPTMGFLHAGHLSLVKEAKQENDIVVMSIFVNPLQFGPNEDFERYPRDEQQDAKVAEQHGVDILFLPTVDDMYPDELGIKMTINQGTDVLCGRSRPGHFDGVITVLTKLFHIVQPNHAYFGLKDAQQFAVVNTLVTQLDFPVQIVGLPTIREGDGLAKSSRNVYLSKIERKEAKSLYLGLKLGQKLIVDGIKNPATIIKEVKKFISINSSGKIDYIELLSFPNLKSITTINQQVILAVAVNFSNARLIDNVILNEEGSFIDRIS